jgi:hypothetical protein
MQAIVINGPVPWGQLTPTAIEGILNGTIPIVVIHPGGVDPEADQLAERLNTLRSQYVSDVRSTVAGFGGEIGFQVQAI